MSSKTMKSHLFLLKLIENSPNKYCADCGTEGTRWASWNLGIFLCIRCAGIHRKLGVHISKVKSVDLDSWTPEQLQSMEKQGNRKSHLLYEARLPKDYVRPTDNYQIEELIRAKYEYKKYFMTSPTNIQSETPNNDESSKLSSNQIIDCESMNSSQDKSVVRSSINHKIKDKQSTKKTFKEPKSDLLCDFGEQNINTNQLSDDSLSDPDYLQARSSNSKKKVKKPTVNAVANLSSAPNNSYHKVHSDGDLINLSSNGTLSNHATANSSRPSTTNKEAIMSLYNSSTPTSDSYYQHSSYQPSNQTSYHRSYGSATYSSDSFTNSIPSTQNSYMKMFQDKLGSFKDQIQNRFSSYEQPNNSSYSTRYSNPPSSSTNYQQNHPSKLPNSSNGGTNNSNTGTGHTLSPDLWK